MHGKDTYNGRSKKVKEDCGDGLLILLGQSFEVEGTFGPSMRDQLCVDRGQGRVGRSSLRFARGVFAMLLRLIVHSHPSRIVHADD